MVHCDGYYIAVSLLGIVESGSMNNRREREPLLPKLKQAAFILVISGRGERTAWTWKGTARLESTHERELLP